jgi:protein involved in polysaccharide export with SLBB domain
VGVFYLGGHVVRPGVYSLTGQEITLKQAILAAGGLDALAWPTRCEIVRRIDGEREEFTQWDLARIMAGQDPDLFLKPEDQINVGTHAIAPLLLTIRNSFRLTYGFGFVYDRNFGDIDTFAPQTNPRERRRQTLAQRFPGLFP